MTSACSTQLKDAPSTVSAPARTGLPRLGTGVLARGTACATLSGSLRLTLFTSFFCSTRAASILPSRPHITIAVARSDGQGRRFFSAAEGLSLTIASTAAGCRDRVVWHSRSEGSLPPAASNRRANHACIRLNPYRGPDHEAVIRFCGQAPKRRVHSPSGIAAIAVCGLPPPRIIIGNCASKRSQRRTLFVLSRSTVLLTSPAATRHRPVSHRS